MENLEVAKYKKKKESNVSKSKAKSDHKHDVVECLLVCEGIPYLATYCSKCGKLHNWIVPTEKTDDGYYRMMLKAEIYMKYSKLPIIKTDNLFIKYLPIGEEV